MGSVKLLLDQARSAGLTVEAHGDKLVVRGPKRAEAIVRELVQHKAAVMEVLTAPPVTKTGADQHYHHGVERQQGPERAGAEELKTEGSFKVIAGNNKVYEVKQIYRMWFFQLEGHTEAGWTCCSPEFVKLIEDHVRDVRTGEPQPVGMPRQRERDIDRAEKELARDLKPSGRSKAEGGP